VPQCSPNAPDPAAGPRVDAGPHPVPWGSAVPAPEVTMNPYNALRHDRGTNVFSDVLVRGAERELRS